MELLNLEKLIKVKFYKTVPAVWYYYRKSKKIFGITFVKEGIYELDYPRDTYYGPEVPEDYILIDQAVYLKPHVVLSFEGDFSTTHWFDTDEEAKAYANEMTAEGSWLLVE